MLRSPAAPFSAQLQSLVGLTQEQAKLAWNECMVYIELNMVGAGVVKPPVAVALVQLRRVDGLA